MTAIFSSRPADATLTAGISTTIRQSEVGVAVSRLKNSINPSKKETGSARAMAGISEVSAAVRAALRGGSAMATAYAAAAAIAMPAGVVHAQSTGKEVELEEIVVTGIRQQLVSAQERKQKAEEMVDAVTSKDMGALPDRSVTEVLQRIPGLAIGRIPDPRDADRIATEGSGVTIRGLSWVRSELNGHSAFSAKNSRTLGFEDIPPEMLAGVDVYKNPSAQQVEGGLAGIVNLRTRLPFDSEGRKLGFSVEESRGDLAKKWKPSGSVLYSDRITTSIGDLGFLASVSDSQLVSQTDTYHVDKYYERTDLVPGQTVFAPGGIGWRRLTQDRDRTGASAALQWRSPNDAVDGSLQYFYSNAKFEQDENAIWNLPGAGLTGTNLTFSNGFLTGGTINDGGFQGSARYNRRETANNDLSLHLNWRVNNQLRLETDVQNAKASTKIMDLTMGPSAGPQFQNTGTYGLNINGSSAPTIVVSPNNILTNPDMVYHGFAMDHHEHSDADAWAYRADAEYTFDNNDWLDRIRFGVRHEDYNSTTRETDYRWGSISQAWAGGPAIFDRTGLPYSQQNFSNWFHGGTAPSGFLYPDTSFFRNYDSFASAVTGLYNINGVTPGCCNWTKWNGDYSVDSPTAGGLGINPQKQKTNAAYVQMSFKHEQWDGNVGVRVVRTETSGEALLKFSNPNNFGPGTPADVVAFSNGAAVHTSSSNTYNHVLPSLNVRYKPLDNLFLRFAVAKAIARPDFPKLLPSITVSPTLGLLSGGVCTPLPSTPGIQGNCIIGYNGYAGNADLKPMTAVNYDFSTEWYINPTNSLTLALFDKELSGFMETTVDPAVPYTNNGVTKDVVVLRPENQGKGHVRGYEVAWNGFFNFLPGFAKNFGARAAYTYVNSGGTRNASANPYDTTQQTNSRLDNYPLEGLSKTSYNAELYYSVPKFEARLAYNWRERYLMTTAAANLNIPAFADDYGQLDASVQWTVIPNLAVGAQAVNLAASKFKILVDNLNGAGLTYHNFVDSDRRYSVYLRATF